MCHVFFWALLMWRRLCAAGVAAVGVALVASAAKGMAGKLCATPLLSIICTLAAVVAYYWPKAYTFPALIAAGGLLTLGWSYFKKQTPPPVKVRPLSSSTEFF